MEIIQYLLFFLSTNNSHLLQSCPLQPCICTLLPFALSTDLKLGLSKKNIVYLIEILGMSMSRYCCNDRFTKNRLFLGSAFKKAGKILQFWAKFACWNPCLSVTKRRAVNTQQFGGESMLYSLEFSSTLKILNFLLSKCKQVGKSG